MIGLHAFAALLPLAFSVCATGALAADAANGATMAKRWCAACHLVAADQRQGNPDVPSFASIGKRPNFNSEKLALFLLDPHPKMPNMGLSRQEAADLAAYIATQGK